MKNMGNNCKELKYTPKHQKHYFSFNKTEPPVLESFFILCIFVFFFLFFLFVFGFFCVLVFFRFCLGGGLFLGFNFFFFFSNFLFQPGGRLNFEHS